MIDFITTNIISWISCGEVVFTCRAVAGELVVLGVQAAVHAHLAPPKCIMVHGTDIQYSKYSREYALFNV